MNTFDWNIVADENIPYVEALFSVFGNVQLRKGRDINKADVAYADILLVRSVTPVNKALLENSRVRFVGTCTIGTDHLDTAWLEENNIAWASAPGCNAKAVVQYVLSAMAAMGRLHDNMKVAVVGCGNVGAQLYRVLSELGCDCVGVDPFLTAEEFPGLQDFDAIYDCDWVSVHTPLTRDGEFPTWHMFNETVFPRLKTNAVLLNAGRGPVVDNEALCQFLQQGGKLKAVLDVWETEPHIHEALLQCVDLATPHIAGYSFEGRTNGSLMIFSALREFAQDHGESIQNIAAEVREKAYGLRSNLPVAELGQALLASYDIREDDARLRENVAGLPGVFDALRKNYRKRREPSHYVLEVSSDKQDEERAVFDPTKAQAVGFGLLRPK